MLRTPDTTIFVRPDCGRFLSVFGAGLPRRGSGLAEAMGPHRRLRGSVACDGTTERSWAFRIVRWVPLSRPSRFTPLRRVALRSEGGCTSGFLVPGTGSSNFLFSGRSRGSACRAAAAPRGRRCARPSSSSHGHPAGSGPRFAMGGLRARRRSSSRPVSGWVGRGLAAQRSAWGFWFRPNMPLQLPAAIGGSQRPVGAGRFGV